jgi:release factor glutamine methyltransferase
MPEAAVAVEAVLAEGRYRLHRAGVADCRREALRIWADLADVDIARVLLHSSEPADSDVVRLFHEQVLRRCSGEPLAHVTGVVGFRHLTLRSDARALIPRPETEMLVDLLLDRMRTGRVADIGTGSGCLALSLAQEGNFSEIVAVDCSGPALALARLNQKLADLPVTLVQGDLCAPFHPAAFDALVSNPPYLTAAEYAGLDSSVSNWEPGTALVSGPDGMGATARLLDEGRSALRVGGWLALEVDCSRAGLVAERARALGWDDVKIHMDLFGRERYLLARRSNTR